MAKKNKGKSDVSIGFPKTGLNRTEILSSLQGMRDDDAEWQKGKAFSLVYYPGEEISQTIKDAHQMFFSENALNPTAFPSLRRMEVETVKMVADLLGGDEKTAGTLTSGGTESILLAVKTAREWAKVHKPAIEKPEIVVALSVHPAFMKACHYFGIKIIVTPLTKDYLADPDAIRSAINRNTIMIVGSSPSYPHGLIDPITELGEIALNNDLLFHVDSCVGGFILPFLRKLGQDLPPYDLSVPGVTSISADLHKYGYAAKGTSMVLYKTRELRKFQFYIYTGWNGGVYGSPGIGGTRPGGNIAAAWATLMHIGEDGYLKLAAQSFNATNLIKSYIENHPEVYLLGNPQATLLGIASDSVDMYAVADELSLLGWHMDRLQDPAGIHLTVSAIHEAAADQFLKDFASSIEKAKKISWNNLSAKFQVGAVKGLKKLLPEDTFNKLKGIAAENSGVGNSKRQAAMYGMMGALKDDGSLDEMVLSFLDELNS